MAAHIERSPTVTQTAICRSAGGHLRASALALASRSNAPRSGAQSIALRFPEQAMQKPRRASSVRGLDLVDPATDHLRVMPPLSAFKRFDVRDRIRRGIEPFPEILQRVEALGASEGLIVIAPFLPSPLVERLAGAGFASKVERGAGADWMVYFWRETE